MQAINCGIRDSGYNTRLVGQQATKCDAIDLAVREKAEFTLKVLIGSASNTVPVNGIRYPKNELLDPIAVEFRELATLMFNTMDNVRKAINGAIRNKQPIRLSPSSYRTGEHLAGSVLALWRAHPFHGLMFIDPVDEFTGNWFPIITLEHYEAKLNLKFIKLYQHILKPYISK